MPTHVRFAGWTGLFLCAVASSTVGATVDDALLAREQDGRDWAAYGRTFSENHYSPLDSINTSTVSRLSLAWYHDIETGLRADSQPLEAGGVVYVATGLSVVRALDARSGKRLWQYDPEVGTVAGDKLRPSWGIRGLALWGGRVFVGTQDGRLIAIDALSGRLAWSVVTLDQGDESTITGAPRAFNGKVIIGSAGAERGGTRGVVNCNDAATGKRLWRFYTIPGNPADGFENDAMREAATTWTGEWWRHGVGGGTVWNAMTYDPELNRVYVGTGNGGPWNWKIRNPGQGDNLFLASVVALDANTGRYVWHYQENPNEAWDYNSTMDIEMATLVIDGKPRKVLMHAPKNGFFYVIDRETGKLISAEKLGKVTWAERIDLATGRPVEAPGIRYEKQPIMIWPGYYGVHNWPPMSFSPKERLVFIPTIHMAAFYNTEGVDEKTWTPVRNTWTTGLGDVDKGVPLQEFGSALIAWDPIAQRELWRVPTAGTWGGGTMATAGGLVFQGQLDGTFSAYDVRSGKSLWNFSAGVAVVGAPISYSVDGRQYVTVLAGPTSGTGAVPAPNEPFAWDYRNPRRVLTFALDGQATLPAGARFGPASPLLGGAPADPVSAKSGATLFGTHCVSCHGPNAVSRGSAPDLRASPIALSPQAFAQVVQQGTLIARGMPHFGELTAGELESLRQYIRFRAEGKTPGAGGL